MEHEVFIGSNVTHFSVLQLFWNEEFFDSITSRIGFVLKSGPQAQLIHLKTAYGILVKRFNLRTVETPLFLTTLLDNETTIKKQLKVKYLPGNATSSSKLMKVT